MSQDHEWFWCHSSNGEEGPWYGRCATREEAIEEGRDSYDEDFYICEALNPPIDLSDWIDIDSILDRAEDAIENDDRVCSEFDPDGVFKLSTEEKIDLETEIKRAVNKWQAENGITFKVNTFAMMRKSEFIKAPWRENRDATL